MSDLPPLTSDSTLGELPLQDFLVSPTTLGQIVAHQFEQQPDLAGVIVADDEKLLGMISRRRFHEQISYPFGREIFLKRPIQNQYSGSPSMTQELEETVAIPDDPTPPEEALNSITEGTQALIQKIALAEATLSELQEITRHKDSEHLIQKIQRTLNSHKKYLVQ